MPQFSYLPELAGLTEMGQRKLSEGFGQERNRLKRSFGRTPMQGSGAYFQALAGLGAKEQEGRSDIEAENIYKNAMLQRDERLTGEQRDWQKLMADEDFKRQMKMAQTQRQWAQEDMLGNALGSLVGTGISTGLGWLGSSQGWGMNPIQSAQYKWMKDNPSKVGQTFGFDF